MRRAGTSVGVLFWSLMVVSVIMLSTIVMFTMSAVHTGYTAFSTAAQEAAWAGQSQLDTPGNVSQSGYYAPSQTINFAAATSAAQQVFQQNVRDLNMTSGFSQSQPPQIQVTLANNNTVEVIATGTFTLPWLQSAFGAVDGGQLPGAFSIPMRVTEYGGKYEY